MDSAWARAPSSSGSATMEFTNLGSACLCLALHGSAAQCQRPTTGIVQTQVENEHHIGSNMIKASTVLLCNIASLQVVRDKALLPTRQLDFLRPVPTTSQFRTHSTLGNDVEVCSLLAYPRQSRRWEHVQTTEAN